MKSIRKFIVRAVVPESLAALEELAGNLRWSWHEPSRRLFEHIDPELWSGSNRDPVTFLGQVSPKRLEELARDEGYVAWANGERDNLRRYLTEPRWFQQAGITSPRTVAYFSPEFGITAALPQYSGGLGILAGDHVKAASDLGVPLIGVGLFYKAGYFSQSVSSDGWQLERYPLLDPDGLPLSVVRRDDGTPLQVTLALPDEGSLHARVWKATVGRATLLLLDTDIPGNTEGMCGVTDRLYGGGGEHRLLQELLLGIGGARAVRAYCEIEGIPAPDVYHMNEGHAGFLGLERIATFIAEGMAFTDALQRVRAGTVFTTHTPVPAGIDRFDRALVTRYLTSSLLPGVDPDDALALGNEPGEDGSVEVFNMAVMGLRLAGSANGVSKLHGEVSRRMFGELWPGFDGEDVPITSVTNGVHAPTWVDPQLSQFAESKLGSEFGGDWRNDAVTDEDFWNVKREMRSRLVDFARRRLVSSWQEQHPGAKVPTWVGQVLDPNVLTVGFARRVPTYKRLTLMLQDPARLAAILTNPERPVQFIVAGKSHPADDEGKRLIQRIIQFSNTPELRGKIVFLPDYDMAMAELLYPGCDLWLNNPLRPLEACGTSGMKAAMNGALNLSILDGWWAEFAADDYGWVIPSADSAGDSGERDALEAASLYDILEHRVAPRFYDQDGGVPREWIRRVRSILTDLAPSLNAERMVREYVERLYQPAAERSALMGADGGRRSRELATWIRKVRAAWPGVHVVNTESGGVDVPRVGDTLQLRVWVELNNLSPDDVTVDVVHGRSSNDETIDFGNTTRLTLDSSDTGGSSGGTAYSGSLILETAGSFGYNIRVLPKHESLVTQADLGLIAVAG